ncbi:MAG: hypothetical protein ABEI99_01045, partial [Halobaculum sp.]
MGQARPAVAVLLATLLVVAPLGALPLAAGAAPSDGGGTAESTTAAVGEQVSETSSAEQTTASDPVADDEIRQNTTLFRTPETPGSIRVRFRYTLPDYLSTLTVQISPRATVTRLDGFERNGTATFEWD